MFVLLQNTAHKFSASLTPVVCGKRILEFGGSPHSRNFWNQRHHLRFSLTGFPDPVLAHSRCLQPTNLPIFTPSSRLKSAGTTTFPVDWREPSVSLSTTAPPISVSVVSPLVASPDLVFNQLLGIACSLSKARLSLLVVFTATVGCALAASTSMASTVFLAHPAQSLICLALGTGLTSCAANTVNQIMEIPFDSQMVRTQNRVLVRGLATPGQAGLFSVACAGLGLTILYSTLNPLVASLAACNILMYTTLYTPLKQFSQANTWIGSLVGAVPPLMGWAATTGDIQSGSLILAGLLYVWQFPHFMALSWNLRHEYSKAGYMMTSVLEPATCKGVALRYAVASSLVCLAGAGCSAMSLGPWAGCALGLACLPPNVGLIYYAWKFAQSSSTEGSSAAARRLFKATLFHLPVVMMAALLGTYCCTTALAR